MSAATMTKQRCWVEAPAAAPALLSAQTLLLMLAFAWPWQALQILPALNLFVDEILALGIVVLALLSLYCERQYRGSFDLLWPGALLCLLLFLISPLQLGSPLLSLFLYLGIVHLQPSRALIVRALWFSLTAGAGAALVTVYGRTAGMFPSDIVVVNGVATYFAHTLQDAWWLHVMGLCLGSGLALAGWKHERDMAWRMRTAAGGFAGCHALALFLEAPPLSSALWAAMPHPAELSGVGIAALALTLYLVARVGAKLLLSFKADFAGLQPIWFMLLLLGTGLNLLLGRLPGVEAGFLLGLAAAYASPGKPRKDAAWMRYSYLSLALLPLLFWNLLHVSEGNTRDPRHYTARYQAAMAQGRTDQALARLELLHQRFPLERRLAWLLAGHMLHMDAPEAASLYLRRAAAPGEAQVLAPPSPNALESMLVRLRDAVSGLPPEERGVAYERALMGLGRDKDAWASLRLRAEALRVKAYPDTSVTGIQQALLTLLSGEEAMPPETWDENLWLRVFEVVGGRFVALSDSAEALQGAVLLWRLDSDTHMLGMYTEDTQQLREVMVTGDMPPEVVSLDVAPVLHVEKAADGWTLALSANADKLLGDIRISDNDQIRILLTPARLAAGRPELLQGLWLLHEQRPF